jgi:5'-deoxynucleotidase YfbR-like HD superfamily hydrolase
VPVIEGISALKRTRSADDRRSFAEVSFLRSWRALAAGVPVIDVAAETTARALVACTLGAIDEGVLAHGGLSESERRVVLEAALKESAAGALDVELVALAQRRVVGQADIPGPDLDFATRLCDQPRAGATRRGVARVVMDPWESHGDHSWGAAVAAMLIASVFGADIATSFLAGLSHHIHNAWLPDAGHAGDEVLGEVADRLRDRFLQRGLSELPAPLRELVLACRPAWAPHTDSPAAQAFHAADVLDRVVQQRHLEPVASVSHGVKFDNGDLVYEGPLLAFQRDVLAGAGLLSEAS